MDDVLFHMVDLHFSYGDREILGGISLGCRQGKVTVIMGPSGCGKSTLLYLVAGLLRASRGRINTDNVQIGMMFQEPLLLPWRTVLANVAFPLKGKVKDAMQRETRAREALELAGLEDRCFSQFPHQLSGGMRQRVSLARALVIEPDLLILDEPFQGLDEALSQQLLRTLRNLVNERGLTILGTSHDRHQALDFADEIITLQGSPAVIVEQIKPNQSAKENRQ